MSTTEDHCHMANSVSLLRWLHRFLVAKGKHARKLKGIAKTDEIYFLDNRKGKQNFNPPSRKCVGKATKSCLSNQKVPALFVADLIGTTGGVKLLVVNAEALRKVIQPIVGKVIILVRDVHCTYSTCAATIGVRHRILNLSTKERVLGPFHIQKVNNRHIQFGVFMHHFRYVATKNLYNFLLWFNHFELEKAPPRT